RSINGLPGVLPHLPSAASALHGERFAEIYGRGDDPDDLFFDPHLARRSRGARPFSRLSNDLPWSHQPVRTPQTTGPHHLSDLALRVGHGSYNLFCSVPLAAAVAEFVRIQIASGRRRNSGEFRYMTALRNTEMHRGLKQLLLVCLAVGATWLI